MAGATATHAVGTAGTAGAALTRFLTDTSGSSSTGDKMVELGDSFETYTTMTKWFEIGAHTMNTVTIIVFLIILSKRRSISISVGIIREVGNVVEVLVCRVGGVVEVLVCRVGNVVVLLVCRVGDVVVLLVCRVGDVVVLLVRSLLVNTG